MDVQELTILTGWAQALAEALAYDPGSVRALLADAHAGAPWRAALRLPEPSPQFSRAIDCMGRAIQELTPPHGVPTLDALVLRCQEDRPGQEGADRLILRVLRSTLDQLRTREVSES